MDCFCKLLISTFVNIKAKYLVENKMPGRAPGSTLFLTTAVQRNGEKVEMVEGQSFKLWLVARLSNPLLDQLALNIISH